MFFATERVEKCGGNSIYFIFAPRAELNNLFPLGLVGRSSLPASGYNKLYQSSVAYWRRHFKHYRAVLEQHFRFSHISYIGFTQSIIILDLSMNTFIDFVELGSLYFSHLLLIEDKSILEKVILSFNEFWQWFCI